MKLSPLLSADKTLVIKHNGNQHFCNGEIALMSETFPENIN